MKTLVRALALTILFTASAMAGEMKPFIGGSWQEILKANAGKPAVVHFWGLTCAPCIVELPRWAALKKERPEMAMIMVASDPLPADVPDQQKVIGKAGLAAVENWTFADAFTERLRREIDPKWRGEMPRTIMIARDGTPTVLAGPVDTAAIRNWYDAQAK
jgi:thiol-disulfide isomerase/thioredoxin